MTKPIQIRNEDVARDIRELASLTHTPLTDAVANAVRAELVRARRRMTPAMERERQIDALIERVRALPRVGPPLTDDDLYDDDGLPR